jgi:3-hydroxy-9,10-secoandrosta-1,3,5(10)-triene-9,17-dione monooxygenase reductase component
MGHFPTGVTIVTSRRSDGAPCGLTANAVASVSLDPLLVLVCVDRASVTHGCITAGGSFGISVLSAGDEEMARRFAHSDRGGRFDGVELKESRTGSPILAHALAWMDCRVNQVYQAGDHSIVVGDVLSCDAREGEPLVFFRGEFHGIQ